MTRAASSTHITRFKNDPPLSAWFQRVQHDLEDEMIKKKTLKVERETYRSIEFSNDHQYCTEHHLAKKSSKDRSPVYDSDFMNVYRPNRLMILEWDTREYSSSDKS